MGRALNRTVAAVVVLAAVVASAALLVEVVVAATGNGPVIVPYDRWLDDARGHRWGDRAVLLAGVIGIVAGIGLLAISARRGRPAAVPLDRPQPTGGGTVAALDRRSLQRAIGRRASALAGVGKARTTVRRREVRVDATTAAPGDPVPVRSALERQTGVLLERAGLAGLPRRVRLRERS